ncbi:GNAT family N-acetyltransferase [Paraglaciecola polaris]|uniref:GCN5-related N-acetyltransferase n=1 Tax=Paraglaciecola polaris LMG 21857 TaxID=1129793 RepID=K6YJB8_9ALTE|nr:GNAT family N-acetyltransferase [Paraglaciecola polaris]GAC32799.1 GCN5-related N-acetyltransferase [Paraglaciecola polaris LMG 21857]|tara:strand:+ start:755 stop:1351 length:597 start_codon:yes stop_codon:yes gene_type:complete
MSDIEIRNATVSDFMRIVELNQAEVAHTSQMDFAALSKLHSLAAYHRVIEIDGVIAGFLLVMGPDSQYINDNYDWFKKHHANFMYIDRIVLSHEYQGKQLGQGLYYDLFAFSKQQGIEQVVCEYNVEPPNLPSAKFHQRLGFSEVGSQWLPLNKFSANEGIVQPMDNSVSENYRVQDLSETLDRSTHKKVSMQCRTLA